ncbi:MAG: DUF885 family protein, partial [Candidatus Hodarchaeota archaeon]
KALLDWYLDMALFELEKMRFWTHNPQLTGLILSGLNTLLLKTHPSAEKRAFSMVKRLKGISRLVEKIKTRVSEPVQLWVDSEIRACKTLSDFMATIPEAFSSISEGLVQALSEAATDASKAMEEYRQWLESIEGSPALPANKGLYEELILKRHLGMEANEIEELGKHYLQETQEILTELVTKLPGESVTEIRSNIRKKHPASFEEALENYSQLAKRAKEFLIKNDILTIPPKENHQVMYTPPPIRHLMSLAGASPPGRYDDPQTGYFWCCPHDDPKMLLEHPNAWASILMTHESYPGHNLHAVCANSQPSLVRTHAFARPSSNLGLMYPSQIAEIIEGWALYCEEMMLEHGFEDNPANPNLEKQFSLINAVRWRAARMVIDVQLHTGRITYEEAVDFLASTVGFSETICRAEILMYSQSPGYFLSYLLGKHLLVNLKQELDIPEKEFHDKIVYSGFVPFWFLKTYVFS